MGKQLLKRTLAGGHSRALSSLPVFTFFEVAALVLAFYLFRAFWLVPTTLPRALVAGAARNRPGRFLLLGFCARQRGAGAEPRAARAAEPGLEPTREGARAASGLAARPRVCRTERAPHGGHAPGPALSALPVSPSSAHTLFSRQPCLRRDPGRPTPTRVTLETASQHPPRQARPAGAGAGGRSALSARGDASQEAPGGGFEAFPSPEARRCPPPARQGPDFPVPVGRRIAAAPRPPRPPPPPSQQGRPRQAREG